MTQLTGTMLRQYSRQVDQQIDEYADRMDDLKTKTNGSKSGEERGPGARPENAITQLERSRGGPMDRAHQPA